ncbi:HipA family kinase [Idiomarina sp. PL1-037]|uniref:HipA family kinase n=1 Tax=Idiomarina sp. PL1-037 TaxID=3095365 RepID=UPI002ACBE29A|nr:HipA family kinase [Idiomarina sp. PL1-037]WQC52086.1 HipA family kinase [Idiomarina sp. PL1-037]
MIEIKEIIRPLEQGSTRPFLCVADDGKKYVVKGQRTTNKQLISEYVCAHLAKRFGLPLPNFKVAYIDSTVIKYNEEAQDSLGEGDAFASEFIDGLQEVNYQLMMNFGQEVAANLFIFDLWVRNGDRTLSMKGGNPNVFYQPAEQRFWALDHNLAFDDSFEFYDFTKDHLGRDAWIQQRDLLSRQLYQDRASNCLRQLDEIFSRVPDEWDLTDDFMEQIRLTLGLINHDNFWERI